MSLQKKKYDKTYWEDMVDDGNRYVSAKTMIIYIACMGIIVQSIALMITPSSWLIWNALGFVVATNLGAVVLAIKAQHSAEEISKKTSMAFNADFYHTFHILTEIKNKFVEVAEKDGKDIETEIDELGEDLYSVVRGYLKMYNEHSKTKIEMVETKEISYEHEKELFN